MKYLALVVFGLHTLFEATFGLNAFISGGSSSQTAAEIAAQSSQLTTSARFLGSALLALACLGAAVIFGPGVQSPTARLVSLVLGSFHTLGVAGLLITARADPALLTQTHTLGALGIHACLAIGFFIILVGPRPERPDQNA